MADTLTIVDHPLIQHKLTILRNKETPTAHFRQVLREVAFVLGCEATKDLALGEVTIETPLEKVNAPYLEGKKLCFVSILRAGNGLIEGLLDLIPSARVGHVGLYRDHETLEAIEYYFKTPDKLNERLVIMVDPMLATGNTAIAAANKLKDAGARDIKFLCLVAAPEGVEKFSKAHPDIPIITAALDRELNEIGYILPGLGDAGDRIYGTKG
ncbi:uracil phosphoribosyltransferase [Hyphococcus flavus]|uniref:Uracil phosphoribosyltransferase n=1 Tax=Hyphococcus flavus TaxID=1866326 RepID=A0AAF0CHB7_9PROT|nr:uracil phosphoribosyltransferase [Hyphococcus flavus]WDI33253.1 uracil phosphoribosyltransferase [Hyphococcus flavus]